MLSNGVAHERELDLAQLARDTQQAEGREAVTSSTTLRKVAEYLSQANSARSAFEERYSQGEDGDRLVTKVSMQLLANMAGGGRDEATAVWQACWPDVFTEVARDTTGNAHGPLLMTLFKCCLDSEARSAALNGNEGLPILRPLLEPVCCAEEAGDYTLAQLVSTLSLRTGRLPLLCQPSAVAPLMELRSCHAWILAALVEAVEESRLNHLARLHEGHGDALATHIMGIVEALASLVALQDVERETLQSALQFLRSLTSLDDGGAQLSSSTSPVQALLECGLVQMLLGMLAALGPLEAARRSDLERSTGWPECRELETRHLVKMQPYNGYRTDLVAVLANTAYRRKAIQDTMLRVGGVELILAHCQVSESNPFLREAGLWAVRNLCEGNLDVQERIEELQVVDTVQSPELDAAGVQLQHDPATGKLNLVGNINEAE